ncbi:Starch-binding associating with outer membrane [Bacteroidales bacterium Barb4]|nr:Starch-binding associating with outer membrane [Bacteroidales bacterium Barb4]
MRNKNIISIALAASFVFASCNDRLDEINENPNATEKPQPAYLLTGVEKQGADAYWGISSSYGSTLLIVQQWAKIQYAEQDRYEFSNSSSEITSLWNTGYATLITDLNTILDFSEEQANTNYKGVALTLRSWVFSLLTDLHGDIPYKEVGKSVTPAYNTQKEVYEGLLADLSQALTLLDAAKGSIAGDVIYKGDIAKWKKFANSLKLRIALRLSDRDSNLAGQTIAEVTGNPAGLISDNSETFQFVYSKSPQHNPQASHYDSRDDYRISKTIVNALKDLSDPRLPIYAQLPEDSSVGDYAGGGNGLSNGDANNQGFSKISKPGKYFLTPEAPAVIYSYAEVLFNLAEAAARGYIQGNAEDYYKQAITASLNQFGITDVAVIAAYLSQDKVKYNAANYKKSIGEQKWIAFFGQGLDAFTEWRRLDYPELTAGPAAVLEGKIPTRFFYPGTEQSLNGKSYQSAIANQGADLLTTKLWFDVY